MPRFEILPLGKEVVFESMTERDLRAARDQLESKVAERTRTLLEEIEQRKRTEEALAKSERRFRAIFTEAFQFMGLTDAQGTLLDANPSALALVGAKLPEVIGRPLWETPWWSRDPEEAHKLRNALTAAGQGAFVRYESNQLGADGSPRVLDFSLKPIEDDLGNIIMIILEGRDITDIRRSEQERMSLTAQLHQSQRLEALGRLAGGVAHDFNNLLTVIMGNLSLLQATHKGDTELEDAVGETLDAAARAAALTRQLLAFSRRQIVELIVFDPVERLDGIRKLLPRVVGENIDLQVHVTGRPGAIFMDPSQFEQIVMNLVVNARDAMPTGGRLDVSLRWLDGEHPKTVAQNPERTGTYALLEVTDTGTGIPAADLAHIFEPFFTTKAPGSGTGLGLATVHGIVTQALGWITVDTALGKGTSFRVYLPCCEDDAQTPSPIDVRLAATGTLSGTVLVVEDQTSVRQTIVRSLKHSGFEVQAFADAASALAYARGPERVFEVVLTDVMMPGMGGRALADTLRRFRPFLPIVFMSGHTDDTVLRNGFEEAREYFLAKPFTPTKLVEKLRFVLHVLRGRP